MVVLFRAIPCRKTLATHIAVGMGAASFWRGAWYVLDDQLFPENAAYSAAASWGLGVMGMAASQGLVARAEQVGVGRIPRLGAIYCVATSCVLVWRGTWTGWDCLYEYYHSSEKSGAILSTDPGHATKSGILSHVAALSFLVGAGLFASVLAPPASVSVIRDLTVRGGGTVRGPAQKLVDNLFSRAAVGKGSGPGVLQYNGGTRRLYRRTRRRL